MLKQDYLSPRWTGEICDCSMPMTFDTYSSCSFNCLYCFAYFQKSHVVKGYRDKLNPFQRDVRSVNPEKVIKLFEDAQTSSPQTTTGQQFQKYIQNKITMQWGGLADGFDNNEKKYGISLKLLKYFDKIDYPLSISTKGTWFTKEKKYMNIIKKHPHNWHFKISIITNNSQKASIIEEGVPTPHQRIKAIKRLTDNEIPVTLRLRPYIIGLSEDYPTLIEKAHNAGADSVTTEFFCLELRAKDDLKKKYDQISNIVGYDLLSFYKKNSKGSGYLRLNYKLKRPIIKDMKSITHKNHMRFYVSDAHHKEKSDGVCCCGCPPSFKVFKGQYAGALQKAKINKDSLIKWGDFSEETEKILGNVNWYHAEGFNTTSSRERAKRQSQSFYDYLRDVWNTPSNAKSPYKYFEKILYPVGLDKNNDVIYKYWRGKADK